MALTHEVGPPVNPQMSYQPLSHHIIYGLVTPNALRSLPMLSIQSHTQASEMFTPGWRPRIRSHQRLHAKPLLGPKAF